MHLSSFAHAQLGQITLGIFWFVKLKSLTGLGQMTTIRFQDYLSVADWKLTFNCSLALVAFNSKHTFLETR